MTRSACPAGENIERVRVQVPGWPFVNAGWREEETREVA